MDATVQKYAWSAVWGGLEVRSLVSNVHFQNIQWQSLNLIMSTVHLSDSSVASGQCTCAYVRTKDFLKGLWYAQVTMYKTVKSWQLLHGDKFYSWDLVLFICQTDSLWRSCSRLKVHRGDSCLDAATTWRQSLLIVIVLPQQEGKFTIPGIRHGTCWGQSDSAHWSGAQPGRCFRQTTEHMRASAGARTSTCATSVRSLVCLSQEASRDSSMPS